MMTTVTDGCDNADPDDSDADTDAEHGSCTGNNNGNRVAGTGNDDASNSTYKAAVGARTRSTPRTIQIACIKHLQPPVLLSLFHQRVSTAAA